MVAIKLYSGAIVKTGNFQMTTAGTICSQLQLHCASFPYLRALCRRIPPGFSRESQPQGSPQPRTTLLVPVSANGAGDMEMITELTAGRHDLCQICRTHISKLRHRAAATRGAETTCVGNRTNIYQRKLRFRHGRMTANEVS